MRRNDAIRLRHMLDAAREAMAFVTGCSRASLDGSRMLALSLVKEIEIIGEAAYQISEESRTQMQDIPWEDIISMRHRLVQAYFEINLDILWATVQDDLPALVTTLEPYVPLA